MTDKNKNSIEEDIGVNSDTTVPKMEPEELEAYLQNVKSIMRVRNSRRIFHPVRKIAGFDTRPGYCLQNGAFALPNCVNFTVYSTGATSVELVLFKRGEEEPFAVIPFPEEYRIGKVYSMIVFGLDITKFEYAYRMDGPYDPSKGLLFDKNNLLLDPYARAVVGQSEWGVRETESGEYRARVVSSDFEWNDGHRPQIPMKDLIIYETHVRGFTKHESSCVENPGTFAGLMEKIPYLKELGINAVELMPIFEFDEMRDKREYNGKLLMDYWGYNPVAFFAPNTAYSADHELNHEGDELRTLVRTLHENDMEIILDVVFNHTAEGNENGPIISFKGVDNSVFYLLGANGEYYNFSGCGNALNCNHPIVHQMILECLRHWVVEYHIDGFRFDLASILGRNEDGKPMHNPPLLESLAVDPVLSGVKLIAEAWDAAGLYQVGSFPSRDNRWVEWNGKYRDDLRCFLKGDEGMAGQAARRILGSQDLYRVGEHGESPSVNFITCHDGFTLHDLYAYNEKHNEANGWHNTDGESHNNSWNCGIEGETDCREVLDLRRRLQKNAIAVLMCSRGTPMFLAGDEFGNTQFGNNNPYCQDNEISWLDWDYLDDNEDLYDFFRFMIHFRKQHPILRSATKPAESRFPETSLHSQTSWDANYNRDSRIIGVTFAGRNAEDTQDDIVDIVINAHWETHQVCLPDLPEGMYWRTVVDTYNGPGEDCIENIEDMPVSHSGIIWIQPRSVIVLIAVKE